MYLGKVAQGRKKDGGMGEGKGRGRKKGKGKE